MALKITLKPKEKIIIGGAVITNGNSRNTDLIVENKVPLLRQKDILSEHEAKTPCSQMYFLIQLMYIDEENLLTHQQNYWRVVRELLQAASSLTGHVDQINESILSGKYYQALKLAGELIDYEQEIFSNAHSLTESV
jgi:flagellar protein FlbT